MLQGQPVVQDSTSVQLDNRGYHERFMREAIQMVSISSRITVKLQKHFFRLLVIFESAFCTVSHSTQSKSMRCPRFHLLRSFWSCFVRTLIPQGRARPCKRRNARRLRLRPQWRRNRQRHERHQQISKCKPPSLLQAGDHSQAIPSELDVANYGLKGYTACRVHSPLPDPGRASHQYLEGDRSLRNGGAVRYVRFCAQAIRDQGGVFRVLE